MLPTAMWSAGCRRCASSFLAVNIILFCVPFFYGYLVSLCIHGIPTGLCDADTLFTLNFERMHFRPISEKHSSVQNNLNVEKQLYTHLIQVIQIEGNMAVITKPHTYFKYRSI